MDVNKASTLIAVCKKLLKMKLGDKARLQTIKARAEQGRILYELDKKYVEKMAAYIKYENEPKSEIKSEENIVENEQKVQINFESVEEDIPKQVYNIEKSKPTVFSNPFKKMAEPQYDESSFSYIGNNHYKSEGTTLVLSMFFGLLGYMGIGHRYVGNVKRSIVILYAGYGLNGLWYSHVFLLLSIAIGPMLGSSSGLPYGYGFNPGLHPLMTFILNQTGGWAGDVNLMPFFIAFTIGVPVGYFIFCIWQIFDARSQCRKFNKHMDHTSEQLWSVSLIQKIIYGIAIAGPLIVFIVSVLSTIFVQQTFDMMR